jgi:polysaccharide pyruvyl transferase WcaK-like protein
MLLLAKLYRKRLPLIGAYPYEINLLKLIEQADVLHLSGGGYLTGMTLSRLWDNMLLINLADILGTPVILTGQTVGIFKDKKSRKLARWGLKIPKLIYLRDNTGSLADICSLGIDGEHVKVTFDDALFCHVACGRKVDKYLQENGITAGDSYVVVNTHYFVQKPAESRKVMKRIAELSDMIVFKYGIQILFIALDPVDLASMEEVKRNMKSNPIINYDIDYRITKGIIAKSKFLLTMRHHGIVFAMGSGIPTIAISLDDYYKRKNSGALGLFGQEKWLIEKEKLFREGFMEETIDRLIKELGEQKETITKYLKIMRKQDGEAIRKFMDRYGRQKSLVSDRIGGSSNQIGKRENPG